MLKKAPKISKKIENSIYTKQYIYSLETVMFPSEAIWIKILMFTIILRFEIKTSNESKYLHHRDSAPQFWDLWNVILKPEEFTPRGS